MSKGQVAMEFLYVLGFMILVLTLYSALFLNTYSDMKSSHNRLTIQKYVEEIAMEINIAASAPNGYSSNFTLLQQTEGFNYTLTLSSDNKGLSLDAEEYEAFAPLATGQPLVTGRIEVVQWNYGESQIIEKVGNKVVIK